ncbi:MAG: methyl-accepting chemotaxis protein [Planctomycetes bacterium]|nr:methyl-accepting chemotaxis protein [Planctomycetota bacterium]
MLGLSRLRITSKLMLLVALSATGLGAFGVIAWHTLERTKVGGPLYTQISTNKDLLADVLPPPQFIIESHLVAHLLGDCDDAGRRDELLARYEVLKKEFRDRTAFWNEALAAGELKSSLTSAAHDPAVDFFRVMDDKFVPAVRSGNLEVARSVLSGPMLDAYNRHRSAIDRTVELATAESKRLEAEAAATLHSRQFWLYTLGGALSVGVGVLGWLIATSIIQPLRRMAQGVESIGAAGKMDLTRRIETGTKDELADLCERINAIVSNLNTIIAQVSKSAAHVNAGCRDILTSAESVAQGIDNQSRQTERVSAAVLESNQSIGEVASKAQDASKMTGSAGNDARTGGEVVNRTLSQMRTISDMVRESSGSIADLGARSEEIGRIIDVINDIADQTNLLALNAAIEAARAGEHGRGFAVVADEVRKLADRTTKATGEVATSIRAIQEGTSGAVSRMKDVTERVGEGVSMAEKAGASLSTICDSSGTVAMIVESIASATHEQTAASEEIGRNVTLIAEAGQECNQAARRAAEIATDLTGRAAELEKLVSGFKTAA